MSQYGLFYICRHAAESVCLTCHATLQVLTDEIAVFASFLARLFIPNLIGNRSKCHREIYYCDKAVLFIFKGQCFARCVLYMLFLNFHWRSFQLDLRLVRSWIGSGYIWPLILTLKWVQHYAGQWWLVCSGGSIQMLYFSRELHSKYNLSKIAKYCQKKIYCKSKVKILIMQSEPCQCNIFI